MRRILLALALLAVAACETVPVTGRSQLLLVSEGEETKMGIDAYRGILKKSKVSSDSRLNLPWSKTALQVTIRFS